MDRFEASSEEWRCDKWIAWIKSCRECIFEVLCKFNPYYQKKWQQIKPKEHLAKSLQEWCDILDQ